MSLLPYLLLATTLTVRFALARKRRWGWYLDLASVAPWLAYYTHNGDWPLLAVPLIFAYLDVRALRGEWAR